MDIIFLSGIHPFRERQFHGTKSPFGMGLFMRLLQSGNGIMGVHLGGSEAAVTQQFLYSIQIGSIAG